MASPEKEQLKSPTIDVIFKKIFEVLSSVDPQVVWVLLQKNMPPQMWNSFCEYMGLDPLELERRLQEPNSSYIEAGSQLDSNKLSEEEKKRKELAGKFARQVLAKNVRARMNAGRINDELEVPQTSSARDYDHGPDKYLRNESYMSERVQYLIAQGMTNFSADYVFFCEQGEK